MADDKDPYFGTEGQRGGADPLDDLMRSLNQDEIARAGGGGSRALPKVVEMHVPSKSAEAHQEPVFEDYGDDEAFEPEYAPQGSAYEVEAQYAEPSFTAHADSPHDAEAYYEDEPEEEYAPSEPSFAAEPSFENIPEPSIVSDYVSPYDRGFEPKASATSDFAKADPSADLDAFLSASLADDLDSAFLSSIGQRPERSYQPAAPVAEPAYVEPSLEGARSVDADEFNYDFDSEFAASLDFSAPQEPLASEEPALYAEPQAYSAYEPETAYEPRFEAEAEAEFEEPLLAAEPSYESDALSIDESFIGQYAATRAADVRSSEGWDEERGYKEPSFRGSYDETPSYASDDAAALDDPFDLTASLAESLQASLEQSLLEDTALIEGRDEPSLAPVAPSFASGDSAYDESAYAEDDFVSEDIFAPAALQEETPETDAEDEWHEPTFSADETEEDADYATHGYDDPYEAAVSAGGLATPAGAALAAGVAAASLSAFGASRNQEQDARTTAQVHTFPARPEPKRSEDDVEAISIADLASQYEREVAAREAAKHQPQIEDDAVFPYDEIEKEPRKSRGLAPWLMYGGAAAVVLLSVGVGYTLLFSGSGESGYAPPPIIRADSGEVRSAPEGAEAAETQPSGGNLIFDRVTGTETRTEERIVPRQEDVLQVPSNSGNQLAAESQQDQQALSPGSPRRVQSVSINPDGTITRTQVEEPRLPEGAQTSAQSGADSTGVRVIDTSRSDSGSAQPQTQPETQVAQSATDAGLRTGTETSTQPAETTQPQAEVNPDDLPNINLTSAPMPPRRPAQIGGSSASAAQPVSLQTPVSASGAQQVDGRAALEQAQASVAQPSQPAVSANSASGGFVVQLSATRSEQEALNAFSAYQNRFPSILTGQSPNIQRADLGSRGIYYRLGIGPLGSRDDANNMCNQLRAAGLQDCFVRAN